MTKGELRYIICNRVIPQVFPDVATELMNQILIYRYAFGEDNRTIFQILNEYQINSPVWYWIEQFNATEDASEAFWAWSDHYNGQG